MYNRRPSTFLCTAVLAAFALVAGAPAPSTAKGDRRYNVEISRTSFGIPHIRARSFGSLGYGSGYAFAEDNYCVLARTVLVARGEQARFFGSDDPTDLNSDLFYRFWLSDERVEAYAAAQSKRTLDAIEGYAAGVNRFLRDRGDEVSEDCRGAEWARPVAAADLYRVYMRLASLAGAVNFAEFDAAEPPTAVAATPAPPPVLDAKTLEAAFEPMRRAISGLGSNSVAVGRKLSEGGRGQLLVNPHFPWQGELRFYQLHVTIPGKIDSMGAAIFGSPVPNIAFNRHVAWSHTVSAASRFVIRQLQLDPSDATHYLVDGESRAMTPVTVSAPVMQNDGSLTTVERTFYDTEYGPIIVVDPLLFWSTGVAYALEDVNRDNFRLLEQYLAMLEAKSVRQLRRALERFVGLPWVNTIAADRRGNALYADIGAIPHLSDEKLAACTTNPVTVLARSLGIFLIDGSRSECALGRDRNAPAPGIFGARNLPSLLRNDYVQNSNDSYWLANPGQPLEGFAEIIGAEGEPQGLRTRLGNVQIREIVESGRKVGPVDMEELVTANRNLSAELALAAVLSVCGAEDPVVDLDGTAVDVSAACTALAGWDGTQNVDATGAVVWREFWPRVRNTDDLFAVPFDPADPIATPRDVDLANPAVVDAVLAALAEATQRLATAGLAPDLAWGDAQFQDVGGLRLPIPGGPGSHGVYNAIGAGLQDGVGYTPVTSGTSILEVVRFTRRGVKARGVLSYSQSTDPESPHFADQTALFSTEGWNDLPFTKREIRNDPAFTQVRLKERVPRRAPSRRSSQ